MTPIDWDSPEWGGRIHYADWAPDAHDTSEATDQ